MLRGLLLAVLLSFSLDVQASFRLPTFGARLYIDTEEVGTMAAGAPTEWLFEYFNADTGLTVDHLMAMHDKKVHLIVISGDLRDFVHIHPDQVGNSGLYRIRVNEASPDPDNFDTIRTVRRGGDYFLFSEVMPPEAPMTTIPVQIRAEGPVANSPRPSLDPIDSNGTITKYFGADGSDGQAGDTYRMAIKQMPTIACGTLMVRFWLNVEELEPATGSYRPVGDIESWLGRYGHGIVIGLDGKTAAEKVFRHIHAIYPAQAPAGPELVLLLDNHQGVFPDGEYKVWIQLKRKGKVTTFAFVMKLERPPAVRKLCGR